MSDDNLSWFSLPFFASIKINQQTRQMLVTCSVYEYFCQLKIFHIPAMLYTNWDLFVLKSRSLSYDLYPVLDRRVVLNILTPNSSLSMCVNHVLCPRHILGIDPVPQLGRHDPSFFFLVFPHICEECEHRVRWDTVKSAKPKISIDSRHVQIRKVQAKHHRTGEVGGRKNNGLDSFVR